MCVCVCVCVCMFGLAEMFWTENSTFLLKAKVYFYPINFLLKRPAFFNLFYAHFFSLLLYMALFKAYTSGTNDRKFTRARNCTKQWYTPGFFKVCDVGSAGNDISAEFKNSNKDMDT